VLQRTVGSHIDDLTKGNRKETRLRKPLSIAPLQFFGVACGERQQTFNLCTFTSVSGISSPLKKSLARRRGLDGPANRRLLVERAAGFDAVGDVSGGPAVPAYRR
jgi:hypothetical protein